MIDSNKTFTVSELNYCSKQLLESHLSRIQVIGEVSGLIKARSGHWYFTLKDNASQIRCAMFRGDNTKVTIAVADGMQIQVTGSVSLYTARGEYQLIVSKIQEVGVGDLHKQLEKLKNKLKLKGLFDIEHKKPIPQWPQRVGIITSSTGAVLQDIRRVFKESAPWVKLQIFDAQVQGELAAQSLITALLKADSSRCNALIIGRGGGSLEDLWCFNDEGLAQAIYNCRTPIISAVGHEIDHSISDYVADKEVATPTYAAKLLCQNWQQAPDILQSILQRLRHTLKQQLQIKSYSLLKAKQQLQQVSPHNQLQQSAFKLDQLTFQLQNTMRQLCQQRQTKVQRMLAKLAILDPYATLDRGYSITLHNEKALKQTTDICVGDKLQTILHEGTVESSVSKTPNS